jgi:hypothetical protein
VVGFKEIQACFCRSGLNNPPPAGGGIQRS